MLTLISILALQAADGNPVVRVREPALPSHLMSSVSARCGRSSLLIGGFGLATGPSAGPQLSIDGKRLEGDLAGRLIADLANPRAAYRLTVRCSGPQFDLRLYRGEADRDGNVRYGSASARIHGGRVTSYTGMQSSDAKTFWFR